MSSPQLRPLAFGEILDVALKIVWRNAGTLARAVVFIVLPLQVIETVVALSSLPQGQHTINAFGTVTTQSGNPELTHTQVAAFATGVAGASILSVVAAVLAAGACYWAIASAYLGRKTSWRESLHFVARRFGSLLWITLLTFLCVLVGLIACVIPGIYLGVCFVVAVPVMLTEGVRGRGALRRSRQLVSGTWWRTLGILFFGGLLTSIINAALSGVAFGVLSIGASASALVLGLEQVIVGTASRTITTPIAAAFVTILYFDLRVRKEGFDLQLLAERIGAEPPDGFSPAARGQPASSWPPPPPGSQPPAGGLTPPTQGSSDPDQPPFWPPPPRWTPGSQPPAGGPNPPPQASPGSEQPPFWPPPPGWKPGEHE